MQSNTTDEFAGELFQIYEEKWPLYELALTRVNDALKAIASDRSLFTVSQQRRIRVEGGRVKEAARLLAKAQASKYSSRIKSAEDVFREINDIAGTRVTCNTVSDVRAMVKGIRQSQTVNFPSGVPSQKTYEDYIDSPKPSGYRAVHLLVEVQVPSGGQFAGIICEVQIRSLLQHAWGELTHEDTFKPEVKVPTLVVSLSKRLATTLAVLDEIAQDLRDELEKIESDPAIAALEVLSEPAPEERPVPQPLFKRGLLGEVFERTMDRPLSITVNVEDRYRREFTAAGIKTKEQLEHAIEAARKASEAAFQEYPVVYDDVNILDAALAHSGDAAEGVLSAIRNIGQRKADQIRQWEEFEDRYIPGSSYVGTVVRVTPRYALIQLPSGDSGILSARHLEQGRPGYANLEHFIAPGDAVRVEVVNSDATEQRIELRSVGALRPRYMR